MNVRHHPEDSLLAARAAGTLAPDMAMVVDVHLSFCAHCRAQISMWEAVAGVLLNDITPAPLSEAALTRTLARLEDSFSQARRAAAQANDNTPIPLRLFMEKDLSQVRWQRAGAGLHYATLQRHGRTAVRLLKGAPGVAVGQHTHRGDEYTVVLTGGYSDVTGDYFPGDFHTGAPDVHHNPTVHTGEDCIILAVTTDTLIFESWVHRIGARLLGF